MTRPENQEAAPRNEATSTIADGKDRPERTSGIADGALERHDEHHRAERSKAGHPVGAEPLPTASALRSFEQLARRWREGWAAIAFRWRQLPPRERILVIVVLVCYFGLVIAFTIFLEEWTPAKYLVTLCGVGLAAIIPDFVSGDRPLTRVFLIGAAAVGIGLVQLTNDSGNDRKLVTLSTQLQRVSEQLAESGASQDREATNRLAEKRVRENAIPEPTQSLTVVKGAARGIQLRADRLAIRVAAMEAQLLLAHPTVATEIIGDADNLPQYLDGYVSLGARIATSSDFPVAVADAVDDIIQQLKMQSAHVAAAKLLREVAVPKYEEILARVARDPREKGSACSSLSPLITQLSDASLAHPAAGLFNHIGGLALACGQRDRALGLFYIGIATNSDHVPLYESIGYALWIINNDSENAFDYVRRGLAISEKEAGALPSEFDQAIAAYEQLKRISPNTKMVDEKLQQLRSRFDRVDRDWSVFMARMKDRLTLEYAYFGALERKNKNDVRTRMKALHDSNPEDAEYQDAMGYVLMRFADRIEDFQQAQKLFSKAAANPDAEPVTKYLAAVHQAQVPNLRDKFERQGPIP